MIKKKSETDWALEILAQNQEALFYKTLVENIADKMEREKTDVNLSAIYTRLNLDNRLVYQGEGYWYYDANRIDREEGK